MLYLEPPFHSIDGVCVLRDHADALQWYALPGAPRLTTVTDLVGGEPREVPQLSLVKFKGTAGTGGFLNFDVDLAISDALRTEVAAEIKRLENLPDTPRVADLPVVDGTVRMMLFDKATPEPSPPDGTTPLPPPPPGDPLQFVLKLDHAAKPALYGGHRAAFSVQLTQEGVTTLEKALQGELSPIGVVYSLDYLGLRPAYHVSVHVDWERVQKHLDQHEEVNVPLVYSSTIDKVVDELVDERIIEITADTFVTEDDGSPVIARRDQAMDDIRDMVTETFFEPSLDPIDRGVGPDDEVRTAGRVLRAIASGGVSEFTAFSRREVDITRVDRKRLDVTMSERTTVERTIYPQGHLSGLFRVLEVPELGMDRFVTEVDLDDAWFQRRELELISRADWDKDLIRSVRVSLEYAGRQHEVLLTPQTPVETASWPSVLEGGGMLREVDTRFTVNFGDVDATERPKSLTSVTTVSRGDRLEVDPRELYSLVPVPVVATTFPWERYPQVEVEVEYDDPANGIAQSDVIVLSAATTAATWHLFKRDPVAGTFRYRTTYRAADLRDHASEWTETDDERITVRDPFPPGRVHVTSALDWAIVRRAFVDLRYEDSEHGLLVQESIEFTEEDDSTRTVAIPVAPGEERGPVTYVVTVLLEDGSIVEVPPSVTFEGRILVREDMRGHRVVAVTTDGADFVEQDVRKITVDLRYEDLDHGLSIADSVTLLSSADRAVFEYDYVSGGPRSYEFRVTTQFTDNLSRTQLWSRSDATALVIPVG